MREEGREKEKTPRYIPSSFKDVAKSRNHFVQSFSKLIESLLGPRHWRSVVKTYLFVAPETYTLMEIDTNTSYRWIMTCNC